MSQLNYAVGSHWHGRQSGQALIESLVVALVLTVLWVAAHWLFHYQDMALSARHASRHLAFLAARTGLVDQQLPDVSRRHVEPFFGGRAHRWADRRGVFLFDAESSLHTALLPLDSLTAAAQPGGEDADATTLRREWALADTGILLGHVAIGSGAEKDVSAKDTSLLKLRQFELPYEALHRSTAILIGAGHSSSDDAAQARTGDSQLAWQAAEARSRAASVEVKARASEVDGGWKRAEPELDWLSAWSGQVPDEVLAPYKGP